MTTRREAALQKLAGTKPRRFIGLRWALVRMIFCFWGIVFISAFCLLPLWLFGGCFGEGLECVLEIGHLNDSAQQDNSWIVMYVYLFITFPVCCFCAYIATNWVVERTKLVTQEELMQPKGRYGLWGLFQKKSSPSIISRHEIRNSSKE